MPKNLPNHRTSTYASNGLFWSVDASVCNILGVVGMSARIMRSDSLQRVVVMLHLQLIPLLAIEAKYWHPNIVPILYMPMFSCCSRLSSSLYLYVVYAFLSCFCDQCYWDMCAIEFLPHWMFPILLFPHCALILALDAHCCPILKSIIAPYPPARLWNMVSDCHYFLYR